jgi:hypothetical protein
MNDAALALRYRQHGDRLLKNGDLAPAHEYFRAGLALDDRDPETHEGLGAVEFGRGNFARAADHFARAVALHPRSPKMRTNLGSALLCLARIDEARHELEEAIRLDGEFAEAHLILGYIHLLHGDFANGWTEYEWRRKTRRYRRSYRAEMWQGQPLNGDVIVLDQEQGLGDTIQFCRYATLVAERNARVILRVSRPLVPLLRSVPGIARVLSSDEPMPPARWVCPLPSLPSIFRTDVASIPARIPYLFVPPARQAAFREELPRTTVNVGIVWSGNSRSPHDAIRSMRLRDLGPMLDVPGISFVSLQCGEPAEQLTDLGWTERIRTLPRDNTDFSDTAAAIMALDLVVTVDTSVAHLAGALGKPVWMLLHYVPAWRWLLGTQDTPWYPTARLFRQPVLGDWDAVVREVASEMTHLVRTRVAVEEGGV